MAFTVNTYESEAALKAAIEAIPGTSSIFDCVAKLGFYTLIIDDTVPGADQVGQVLTFESIDLCAEYLNTIILPDRYFLVDKGGGKLTFVSDEDPVAGTNLYIAVLIDSTGQLENAIEMLDASGFEFLIAELGGKFAVFAQEESAYDFGNGLKFDKSLAEKAQVQNISGVAITPDYSLYVWYKPNALDWSTIVRQRIFGFVLGADPLFILWAEPLGGGNYRINVNIDNGPALAIPGTMVNIPDNVNRNLIVVTKDSVLDNLLVYHNGVLVGAAGSGANASMPTQFEANCFYSRTPAADIDHVDGVLGEAGWIENVVLTPAEILLEYNGGNGGGFVGNQGYSFAFRHLFDEAGTTAAPILVAQDSSGNNRDANLINMPGDESDWVTFNKPVTFDNVAKDTFPLVGPNVIATGKYYGFGRTVFNPLDSDEIILVTRAASGHTSGDGSIVLVRFNHVAGLRTDPVTIYVDAVGGTNIQDCEITVIGTTMHLFFTRVESGNFVNISIITSSDGGYTWSAKTDVHTTVPGDFKRYNPYGRGFEGAAGEFYQPWYDFNSNSTDGRVLLFKTIDSGVSWSTVVVEGPEPSALPWTETAFIKLDSISYLGMARKTGGGLYQIESADLATFTAPDKLNINVATGTCMADLALQGTKLLMVYQQRNASPSKGIYFSKVDDWNDVFGDSTQWPFRTLIIENDDLANGLGYPHLLPLGADEYFLVWYKETDPTRTQADILFQRIKIV